MDEIGQAKGLLAQHRYNEAAAILDRLLTSYNQSDELWYLRGIISLKLKNYDAAQECFERALFLGRKSKYYQIKGMAHFELFEIDEAIGAFSDALKLEPENPTTNFFLAVCYLFQDDPRSEQHIRKAYSQDGKKTRQLLLNFYTLFLKDDPHITDSQRKKIEERMKGMK